MERKRWRVTRNRPDQLRVVTSLGDSRDARTVGGKAFLRKTSLPIFFSFFLFLRGTLCRGRASSKAAQILERGVKRNTRDRPLRPDSREETSRNRLAGYWPVARS